MRSKSLEREHQHHNMVSMMIDIDKMVSDATFYFLVADPKKSIIKVFIFYQTVERSNKIK